MRRGGAFWVAVCLGLGCGAGVDSGEPPPSVGLQVQEQRTVRGATRHVRPLKGSIFGRTVGVDRQGNAFVSLAYERDDVDLGGGALPGSAGLALAKYAPDGQHLWSRGFPIYGGVRPTVSAMAVDAAGNLYVSGEHREPTLSLGGEPLPAGAFLAKYAPDGTHLWSHPVALQGVAMQSPSALAVDERRKQLVVAVNFKDPGRPVGAALVGRVRLEDGVLLAVKPVVRSGSLAVTALALDSSGNIALAGSFLGRVDLGGEPLSTVRARSPFLARFTPELGHLWSRGLSDAEGTATGVAVDGERLFVVGEYSGGFVFQGQVRSAQGQDAFAAAYGLRGEERWVRHFAEGASAVGVDGEGRLVVTGQYRPGESAGGATLPFRSGGTPDNHLFVVKLYQGSGDPEWSRGLFSGGVLRAGALAVTRSGEVLLLSRLEGTTDVGTGPLSAPADSSVFLRFIR
ncbi:hypothetical protein [Archangium sp.]|uniref:hypothetical protein n=1 Tax=Archangium sp. TaxID=1872627 RepID=UPI003899DF22